MVRLRDWQDRIVTQEQVIASHRNNGRAVPWSTILLLCIFVVVLQALSVTTFLVLTWNTEPETQFNRSEKRAANLASDLRATQLDLTGKREELDACEAGQLLLRTNLTTRNWKLAETNRELLRTDQHLRRCAALNEQLGYTVHLIADRAAEALNVRDAELQRQQRLTDLLRESETRREELEDRLEKALGRLEEAKREMAEQKIRKIERWHTKQHSYYDSRRGSSEVEYRDVLWEKVKKALVWTSKKLIGVFTKFTLGPAAGTIKNVLFTM